MKIVIANKETEDTVEVKDINRNKIYIWKGRHGWYKVHEVNDQWASITLNTSDTVAHGYSNSLANELTYPINKNFPVYEFNTMQEMIFFLNKDLNGETS